MTSSMMHMGNVSYIIDALETDANNLQSHLDDFTNEADKIMLSWEGPGGDEYRLKKKEWTTKAGALRDALVKAAEGLRRMHENTANTERLVLNRIQG